MTKQQFTELKTLLDTAIETMTLGGGDSNWWYVDKLEPLKQAFERLAVEHTDAPCFFEFSKNEFDEAAFRRFCQTAGWPPEKVEEHVTRMKEAVAGDDPNGPLHAVLAAGFKRFEIATSPIFGSSAEPTAEHDCPAAGMDISVRGVCAICDALTAPSDTQDSARYRWLRDYARTQGRDQLCCWVGPPWDSSSVILWEDKLDRTIDERIRRSAVNRNGDA